MSLFEDIEKELLKLRIQVNQVKSQNIHTDEKIDPYEISSKITSSSYRYDTSYMKIPYNIPYDSNHIMISNSSNPNIIIIPYIENSLFKFIYSHSGGEDFGNGHLEYNFTLDNPVIVGVKQYNESSFSVLIFDDNNKIYLFKGESPILRCSGLTSSGYIPLSYDISSTYISILINSGNSILCYYSNNNGSTYGPLIDIITNYDQVLSISPIKISKDGKLQRFFISFDDNSHKVFTCNLLEDDDSTFQFTDKLLDFQYTDDYVSGNKKIIDIQSDNLCSNILIMFQYLHNDVKSIAYTQGLGADTLNVNSFYELEDGGSNFTSFVKMNNVVIITLENSNDILFSSNGGMSFNRIRNLINCESINKCTLYNNGSSVSFIYTNKGKKYTLCVDMNINLLNTKIIDARTLIKTGIVDELKRTYWLNEFDSSLVIYTYDLQNTIVYVNITPEVIRKITGRTVTIVRICNYIYFDDGYDYNDNLGDSLVRIDVRIVNSDNSPNDISIFYPDRRSFQTLQESQVTSVKLLSDGTHLYVV